MKIQIKSLRNFLNKWRMQVNNKEKMTTKDIPKSINKIMKEAKWKIQMNKSLMKKPIFKIYMKNNESVYYYIYI